MKVKLIFLFVLMALLNFPMVSKAKGVTLTPVQGWEMQTDIFGVDALLYPVAEKYNKRLTLSIASKSWALNSDQINKILDSNLASIESGLKAKGAGTVKVLRKGKLQQSLGSMHYIEYFYQASSGARTEFFGILSAKGKSVVAHFGGEQTVYNNHIKSVGKMLSTIHLE